jgi:hypothetical protein
VWQGRIEVRIDEKLAYLATAAMLMQPVDDSGEADTHGRHQRDYEHDRRCPQVLAAPALLDDGSRIDGGTGTHLRVATH